MKPHSMENTRASMGSIVSMSWLNIASRLKMSQMAMKLSVTAKTQILNLPRRALPSFWP